MLPNHFPIPALRKKLTPEESAAQNTDYCNKRSVATYPEDQNTGKEGLAGPSELGVYPEEEVVITTPVGGGYYFIPPIPNKRISNISEQFFE
jgi:hypothetical protein